MRFRLRPAAPVFVFLHCAFLLAACGGGGGESTPAEGDLRDLVDGQPRDAQRNDVGAADQGVPETPVSDINFDPMTVLVIVPPGAASGTVNVVVRNDGEAPLDFTSLAIAPEGEGFSLEPAGLPTALAPDETLTLAVTFTPPDARERTGGLIIESNDPDEPRVTISLTGRTAEPCLEVMPRSIDFGEVELGQPSGKFELTVRNCGDIDARLTSVAVADDLQFRVSQGANEGPLTDLDLPANSTQRFDVWYQNDGLLAGEMTVGTIRVESDLPAAPLVEVRLSAQGKESPLCVPQFNPNRLDFGPLRIGTTHTLPIEVTNLGNAPCQILELHITHEDGNPINTMTFADGTDALAELAAGATHTMSITFTSVERDQQGNRDAIEISFTENDNPLNRRERAFLFGVAALAEVATVDDVMDFTVTQAPECASPKRTVGVQNIGLVPLCLTDMQLVGDDCPAFVLVDGPEPADCLTLASGEVAEYEYQFEPARTGEHTCDFVVTTDAMNAAEVHTELRARAVDTPDQTDDFDVGRLNAQQRAYFTLSRPADAMTIAVTVEGTANEEWRFSNMRNAIYFEPADHPAEGDEVVVEYQARCLPQH